jgi:hypothetical protein
MRPDNGDEMAEEPALEPAGVLHADGDAGEQRFKDARRREIEGRTDFPQILRHRLLALRAGHAEAGNIALREVQVMVADPGERQIGEHAVLLGQSIERNRVDRRLHCRRRPYHHPLRAARRAGRIEHDGNVLAACGTDFLLPPARRVRIGRDLLPAALLHGLEGMKRCRIVILQPARLVIDDVFERGDAVGEGLDLVDLLLVADHREARAGMIEHIGHLLGHRVGVDGNGNGAESLRRGERPVKPRPVRPDDRNLVATPYTEFIQAERESAYLVELLRPIPALPDAVILEAHGRPVREARGVQQQIFWERVEGFGGTRRRIHLRLPPSRPRMVRDVGPNLSRALIQPQVANRPMPAGRAIRAGSFK